MIIETLVWPDWLLVQNNIGVGLVPIPQPRDAQIIELLRTWRS
jgi:hypothetical protein